MATTKMTHHFLGNSGLLVSKLSLGAWMFFDKTDSRYTADNWYKMLTTTFKHGINFFDSAENYTDGCSEELTGLAIQRGIQNSGFMGAGPKDQDVSRKHIVEGMKASLRHLQLHNVDVVFCDRSEPYTPIEETVRPMNFVIQQGWATIGAREACEIADRLGLIRPIVEQSQYSIVDRNKVEFEFVDLYKKYNRTHDANTASDPRFATPIFKDMQLVPSFDERVEMADKIKMISSRAAGEPQGARLVDKVTPEVKAKIDAIVNFVPTVPALNSLATLRGRRL
ncbi:NADP-dependent oxidoreductase domain [Phytophthora cactorum]|nr:NADP-dependent oxidoreductase domain [Phytophthora cactorum]